MLARREKSKKFFNVPYFPLLSGIKLQIIKCWSVLLYLLVIQFTITWSNLILPVIPTITETPPILHSFSAVTPHELQPRVQLQKSNFRSFVLKLCFRNSLKASLKGHVSPNTTYFYNFTTHCQMQEFKLLQLWKANGDEPIFTTQILALFPHSCPPTCSVLFHKTTSCLGYLFSNALCYSLITVREQTDLLFPCEIW